MTDVVHDRRDAGSLIRFHTSVGIFDRVSYMRVRQTRRPHARAIRGNVGKGELRFPFQYRGEIRRNAMRWEARELQQERETTDAKVAAFTGHQLGTLRLEGSIFP